MARFLHSYIRARLTAFGALRHAGPVPQTARTAVPELDRETRLLGWIYAAVAPNAVSVPRVEAVLSALVAMPFHVRIDSQGIARRTDELIAAGVAERKSDGVAAVSGEALPLIRDALANDLLEPVLNAFLESRDRGSHELIEYEAMLRGALVAEDDDLFERACQSYPFRDMRWGFLADPFSADVLNRLPPANRADALDACLAESIDRALPVDAVIDACASGDLGRHLGWIGYARVLQGRFEQAEALFEDLTLAVRRTSAARFALTATRGLAAMLQGDDDRALLGIEEALAIKSGQRKRLVFPTSRAFSLSLLALVRADSPESLELVRRILDARTWQDERTGELALVEDALAVKAKSGVGFGHRRLGGRLEVLFSSLADCWFGATGKHRDDLAAFGQRAAANGFAWVAAECEEVLGVGRNVGAAAAGGHASAHAVLGTATLTTLAAPPPTPDRALTMLEHLADSVRDAARRTGEDEPGKRLTWELHQGSTAIYVEAREQQRKAAAWSKGRPMGIKRLSALAAQEDFLLPQDREAIAGAEKPAHDRIRGAYLGVRSLHALAGHPRVFDTKGRTVDVVRRDPELSVVEDDDGAVTVRLEPTSLGTEGEYTARMVGEHRCEVTHFSPVHRRLRVVLGADGLRIAAGQRSRLLDHVSSLSEAVRVQSTVGGSATAKETDADGCPWVRLEPSGAGLSVAVVVEPVPDSGVHFAPGAGGAVVFGGRGGETVQAHRDLVGERQAMDQLVGACPLLQSRPSELRPLVLPEPAQCLELLEQLDSAKARCKWPKGETFRIVGHAQAESLRLRIKSAAQWIGINGELTVGEDGVLDLKELFQRLEKNPGARFLELGKGRFASLTEAFRRQLDDFANLATPSAKGAVRLERLAAPALLDLLDGAAVVADQRWSDWRDQHRLAEVGEPELPSTLRAELRPYQRDGFRWLWRLARWGAGACLADDMGLGKTLQALAVLLARARGGPALVVAPTSVVANWVEEARRFAPTLDVRVYAGPAASRTAMLEDAGPFDVFIVTYGVLQNDIDELASVAWHSAVLDEAQAIKNPSAKRTQAAKRLDADFRMVTTGTPVQNNLMDLYSLLGFVNPGLFGSLRRFRARFLLPIERDGSDAARHRLRRLIAPYVLRRLKADVLDDLPDRTEITLHVKLSEAEANLYEALRRRALEELEAAGEQGGQMRLLAHLTRLRLACCNPKLVMDADAPPSSKLAAFAATLDDLLANRHKVLVFSQFVTHLRLVEEHLVAAKVDYQYLDGSTPAQQRTERINAFQAGDGDVFLISLKAGGFGLNLTAADYVIHLDPWWNPAVEDQASDRAHRIGQSRPVTIYRLVTEGTIEEQIVDLHRSKRELAERLLEGSDAAGRLDAEELAALLRQPYESVPLP